MTRITDQMRRFFAEYEVDQNATQAAIRAGYSPKSAAVTASRMLKQAKADPNFAAIRANTREVILAKVEKPAALEAAENTAAYAITKTLELIEYGTERVPVLGMFGPIVVDGETLMEMRDPKVATSNIATLVRQFPEFSEKHDVNVNLRAQMLALVAGMPEDELRAAKASLT